MQGTHRRQRVLHVEWKHSCLTQFRQAPIFSFRGPHSQEFAPTTNDYARGRGPVSCSTACLCTIRTEQKPECRRQLHALLVVFLHRFGQIKAIDLSGRNASATAGRSTGLAASCAHANGGTAARLACRPLRLAAQSVSTTDREASRLFEAPDSARPKSISTQ
jgi:hypothetical protein